MTGDETFRALGKKCTKLAALGANPDDIFRALLSFSVRMAVESQWTEEQFLTLCRDAFVAGRLSRVNGASATTQ